MIAPRRPRGYVRVPTLAFAIMATLAGLCPVLAALLTVLWLGM